MILTRLLDRDEFGLYAIAVITVEFVHLGVFSWIEAAMGRFWARADREDRISDFVKTLFSFCLIYGVLITATALILVYLIPIAPRTRTILLFALGALSLRNLGALFQESHMAGERIRRYSVVYASVLLGGFGIGILLILMTPLRETAPFIGILIAASVSMIFEIPFMLSLMKGGKYDSKYVRQAVRYGLPISVSLLLTYTLSASDMYFVAYILGWGEAGVYNAGYNLANRSMDVVFVWISMALTPLMIKAAENDADGEAIDILRNCGAGLLWITMPMATGIALVAEPAGILLGEPVRAGAIMIMPYIAFAAVANGMLTYYAQKAFILSEKTDSFIWVLVVPVLVNIGLNIFLIPKYGLYGAVFSTCVAYIMGFVFAMIIGRKHYPLPVPFRAFGEITLCCTLMALVVSRLSFATAWPDFLELIFKAFVGAVVYFLVSVLINSANCAQFIRRWRSC